MHHVTLDSQTLAKFPPAAGPVAVYDEAGNVVGFFSPVAPASEYAGAQPPIDEDEIQRREQRGGGRTTAEILDDLERRS